MAAMAAFTAFVLVVLLLRFPFLEPFHTGKELGKSLSDARQETYGKFTSKYIWLLFKVYKNVRIKIFYFDYYSTADSNNLILFIIIAFVSAFSASLCKEALEDGFASQVKKYFYVLASFVAMDVILQLKSIPYSTSPITFYFELPRCIIALIGIGVTYSHIQQKENWKYKDYRHSLYFVTCNMKGKSATTKNRSEDYFSFCYATQSLK